MLMDHQHHQQQQQGTAYKHYCRICKKGFGCGRALGGHMRAHGINDDPVADQDDDPPLGCGGNWDDKQLNPPAGSKRMYALRTNPNRLRSCRVCENCGKEFLSWKSFLEHGRCSSGEDPDDSSPPYSPRSDNDDGGGPYSAAANWSKGKRTRRTKPAPTAAAACHSTEEEDLANCLVMLSAARVDPLIIVADTEESCASASKDDDLRPPPPPNHPTATPPWPKPLAASAPPVPRGLFECKACKKVFTSHQALGGHRASHKKVKGCFAARLDVDLDEPPPEEEVITHENNNNNNSGSNISNSIDQIGPSSSVMALAIVPFDNPQPLASAPLKKKYSKIHECSICHRQFTSGQALGGHKRCHWITSSSEPVMVAAKLNHMPVEAGSSSGHHHELTLRPPVFDSSDILDLNQPAPVDNLSAGLPQSMQGISPLRLDVPAAVYILPPWTIDRKDGGGSSSKNKHAAATSSNNNQTSKTNLDDEADSNLKLAKLSELKDMNIGGESSPWLQVGIGSSAKEGGSHHP